MWFRQTVARTAALTVVFAATSVQGEPALRSATFAEAVGLASTDPLVRGAERAEATARLAPRRIRGPSDNLSLNLSPGWRRLAGGSDGPDLSGQVSQRWNVSGLVGARRAMAQHQAAAAAARRLDLDYRARLRNARYWIDAWRARERQTLLEEAALAAEERVALIEEALEARVVTTSKLSSTLAFQEEIRSEALEAEGASHRSGLFLALAIDPGVTEPILALGELPRAELPGEIALIAMADRMSALPKVREGLAEVAAARAQSDVNRASNGKGVQLALSAAREYPGDWIGGLGLTVDLPTGQPYDGAILQARAEAELQAGEVSLVQRRARRDYLVLVHERTHGEYRIEALESRELPALRRATDDLQDLARAGEVTALELYDAESRLREASLRYIDAKAELALVRVQLAMLIELTKEVGP